MMRYTSITTRATRLKLLLTPIHFTGALTQDAAAPDPSFTTTVAISSFPSSIAFQSSISTSTSVPRTHTIQVGLLDHKMRPESTAAAVGDIEFDFYPLNHSIVRAEYGFPCIPYEMTGSGKTGFFSGFSPVDKVLDNPPKYSVRVNDTEPILFYCSVPGSCLMWGMVGGINLNSSMSIDMQRALAMNSAYMLQPGELFLAESPPPSGNPASPILPTASLVDSTLAPAAAHTSSVGLSNGTIVGIVIATVSALLFGTILLFCWGRTKSLREVVERKAGIVRRVNISPEQMVHHAHNVSHAGFQSPVHPAIHPESHPESQVLGAYGHHNNDGMGGTGYFPTLAGYATKYSSPTIAHTAYHTVSPGSPPPDSLSLNGHLLMHHGACDPSLRGTPVPGHCDTIALGQSHGQGRVQERPV